MKKYLLLPLLLCSPLFALPLGNPADASLYHNGLLWGDCYENRCCDPCDPCFSWCDAWNLRVGFYGDYVFNRHLELDNHGHGDIDEFELYTNAALLTLNICDRLDVFGTLGTTSFALSGNPKVFGSSVTNALLHLETETAFSWSVGGRLTLWNCNCWYFGLEGQYFRSKADVNRVVVAGSLLDYPDKTAELKYSEWQVGIGASYFWQVACSGLAVVPYTGVKWAGVHADYDNALLLGPSADQDVHLYDENNNKVWGYVLGTTLLFCDALSLTAEGRWGDEKALHINGQFRF